MSDQKTEIDYKNLFHQFPSAIVLLDKLGKIIDVNNRLFEWLGYKPEDVIGKRITNLEYIPKNAKGIVLKKFALRILGKKVPPYNLEFTHKDGTPQIGRISAKLVKDPNTGKEYDLVHIENISIEANLTKALEEKRLESGKRFATLAAYAIALASEEKAFQKKMQEAITLLGTNLDFDRVYIFEDEEDQKTSNTYEWVKDGMSAEKENLQGLSYTEDIPGFLELLEKDGLINAPTLEGLPSKLTSILQSQSIQSLLIIPLKGLKKTYGFMGFDAVTEPRTWTEEEIHLLEIIGQLTTQTFEREESNTLLTQKLHELETVNKLMVGREVRMAELKKQLGNKQQ